jgi:hypothetical protein
LMATFADWRKAFQFVKSPRNPHRTGIRGGERC